MKSSALALPLRVIAWLVYGALGLGILYALVALVRMNGPVYFLQAVVDGLKLGFVYALIALGYTMVYGIVRLINFAHGDVFMVGAFASFYAITEYGWGFVPAILFAMLVCCQRSDRASRTNRCGMRSYRGAHRYTGSVFPGILQRPLSLAPISSPISAPSVVVWDIGGVITNITVIIIVVTVLLLPLLRYIDQNQSRQGHARHIAGQACRPWVSPDAISLTSPGAAWLGPVGYTPSHSPNLTLWASCPV